MAEPLKNIYNQHFFQELISHIKKVMPSFDAKAFLASIFDQEWPMRELRERMRHIAITLDQFLEGDYAQKCQQIIQVFKEIGRGRTGEEEYGFEYMFFPDFIQVFGVEEYETSIKTMEEITKYSSCEFAIRPFLKQYPEKMMAQMQAWSRHPHSMVRRLASEGYRPRLPWGMGVPALKKDPSPILPILETLKQDPSETVRRSVANNLNDISKDHPDVTIQLAKAWKGLSSETDWVVKHACRGLLKQGHPEVMQLFGFGSIEMVLVNNFEVLTPTVRIGNVLEFSFDLTNTDDKPIKLRLEYGLYYLKANGSLSRKVFMISEKEYAAGSTTPIRRKQSFKIITTRKFYPGVHELSVIVNGEEVEKGEFELTE